MEVVISFIVIFSIAVTSGAGFVYYKVTHRPQRVISKYEQYREIYEKTGSDESLANMLEAMEEK